jgi:2-dehydro-3-deoxyphosphogluconate aldolase/(4S)-4-hydroxy-2-oxoglutarate aldolase
MLSKFEVLDSIVRTGAILIVRLDTAEEAVAVSRAAIAGGFRALEITLSVPDALGVIRTLSDEYAEQGVAIGAGTVLDPQAAFACVQAGARILVSPNLNPEMIATANRYQAVSVSGAYTPTEIVSTMEAGADIVKLFPTDNAGPDYVKTIMAPLPQAPILPAGGATPDNVGAWFAAGVTAVGIGSYVTKAARVDGDYGRVTRAAETFLAAITDARN